MAVLVARADLHIGSLDLECGDGKSGVGMDAAASASMADAVLPGSRRARAAADARDKHLSH
jgi:hypothetical protein